MERQAGITLVTLVVTIIILIILAGVSVNTLIGDNGIITKTQQARENIIYAGQEEQEQLNQLFWEMDQEGIYTEDEEDAKKDQMIELLQKQVEELKKQVAQLQEENTQLKEQVAELNKQIADLNKQIEELNKQISDLKAQIAQKDIEIADLKKEVATKQETINNLQSQLDSLNSLLSQTNATAAYILKDYKAYSKGKLVTGTMANNGAVSKTLNCGQSYTIPKGYHNGSGKVTANSLASQTQATATAGNIASGKTAWVNGNKITGTLVPTSNFSYRKSGSFTFSQTDTYTLALTGLTPNTNYVLALYGKMMGTHTAGWLNPSITVTNGTRESLLQLQKGDGDSGYSQNYFLILKPTATTMNVKIYFGGGGGKSYSVDYVIVG